MNGSDVPVVEGKISTDPLQLIATAATKFVFADGLSVNRLFPDKFDASQIEPSFGNLVLPILPSLPSADFWTQASAALSAKKEIEIPDSNNIAKLVKIDRELAMQRYIDQSKQDKVKIETEISEIEQQVESIKTWQLKLRECEQEIAKLQATNIADSQKISQLKTEAIDQIRQDMEKGQSRIVKAVSKAKDYVKGLPVWPLIVLTAINFGYAAFRALQLKDMQLLFVGLLLMLVEGGLVVLFLNSREDASLLAESSEGSTDLPIKQPVITDEKLFVNSALHRAYLKQKHELADAITTQLGGKNHEALAATLAAKRSELEELNNTSGQNLSPDEYLRKRRELDMLKMDLRREESKSLLADYAWTVVVNKIIKAANFPNIESLDLAKFTSLWKQQDSQSGLALWPVIVGPTVGALGLDRQTISL